MTYAQRGLQYVLCPGSMPDPRFDSLYRQIYACWFETWSQTLPELQIQKTLQSDSFTRQDYIGALFQDGECFALTFFRWMDGTRSELRRDSYFEPWSDEHLKVLKSRGERILVCSQFTVHPRARSQRVGFSAKELLTGISRETFMHSGADALTAAMRPARGVTEACQRWGCQLIEKGVPDPTWKCNIDLLALFRDEKPSTHELYPWVQKLWNERLVIPRQNFYQQFLKEHFDHSSFQKRA